MCLSQKSISISPQVFTVFLHFTLFLYAHSDFPHPHGQLAIPIKSTVLLLLALLVIVLPVLKRKKKQKLRGLPELKMRTQLMGSIYSKFCCEEEQSSTVGHFELSHSGRGCIGESPFFVAKQFAFQQ